MSLRLVFGADQNIIYHAILLGFLGCHPVVTVAVALYLVKWLARMILYDSIQFLLEFLNLAGGYLYVACLTLRTSHWLVYHHS